MSETHAFQAEVSEVLHLVIHSLYSNKEVFLRELVSNASDALDKVRFRAVTEPDLLADEPALHVRITVDREAGTITIDDSGVGMTKTELAEHLGTIARSGSRTLVEQLKAQSKGDVPQLIGQFGVGFYAAFLVADRVDVVSRAAGSGDAWRWSSDGKDAYTIDAAERGQRGTAVTLHLKADQKEFLDPYRLRELVHRYSDYVQHPIQMRKEGGQPTDVVPEWETLNRATALWQRPKNEITDAEHDELYKHLSHDFEPPLARTHFRVEGGQEFVALLYIPKRAPFDLDLQHRGVRLFVKRVFVMDDCTELVPEWLRFLRGVVDSNDLPLNVSREVLQDAAGVRTIQKQITKKTLDLLEELAKDRPADYLAFWRAFGAVLKAGVHQAPEHKARIAALLRFESTHAPGELTSLAEYVARMKEGQPAVYYAFGDRRETLADSPYLEALKARGYEVLFMTDPADEWVADGVGEFDGKKLVSVMRADLSMDAEKKEAVTPADWKPLFDRMRALLQDEITDVRVSQRLTESPVCLVVPEGGHHAYVERVLKSYGRAIPKQKRILEVNPQHALLSRLRARFESAPTAPEIGDTIELLYDQALLQEGSPVADPQKFARRLTGLLDKSLTL